MRREYTAIVGASSWIEHATSPQGQLQFFPQTLETSPTQTLSHAVVQQYGSTAQICDAQVLQPLVSAAPVEHSACEHGGLVQARLLHTDRTSPTQTLSQAVVQQ